MFGFFSKKDETKKLLHKTDSQAENIQIHTMARDIESLSHPQKEEGSNFPSKTSRPETKPGLNGLSEQQKNGPFFNKPTPSAPPIPPAPKPIMSTAQVQPSPRLMISATPAPPAPKPKLENIVKPISAPLPKTNPVPASLPKTGLAPDQKIKTTNTTKEDAQIKDGTKKLVVTLTIILTIIAVLAGGYYFWSTRKNIPPEENVDNNSVEEQAPEVIPGGGDEEEQAKPAFSATEKNYFMLDLGSDPLVSFKGMVGDYYGKIVADQISYPVEFTMINKDNDPIGFTTFTQALGIKFSKELLSTLDDSFNFYIYNDRGNPGVGLAIKVKGEMNPEDILLKEEKNLPKEVEPLFPVSQYTIEKNKAFATSEHDSASWGKIGIRFQNIISPENLSVDYAFVNTGTNMLFMSTTRATLRSLIDNTKPAVVAP